MGGWGWGKEEASCSGGLWSPRRHFCFLPGGAAARARVAAAFCGVKAAGATGRWAFGEVWAEVDGGLEWEWERREGPPGMESGAWGPGTRRGVSSRAGWRGPREGCAAGDWDLGATGSERLGACSH